MPFEITEPARDAVAAWPKVRGQLESTVRYLGIEVGDALEMSEQIDL